MPLGEPIPIVHCYRTGLARAGRPGAVATPARVPGNRRRCVLASHEDGRCLIQFAKTPMTLVSAQTTRTNWLIQFPPARMSFRGRRQPPTHFAWLYLYAALSGQPLAPPFRFEREPDGGWRLENPRSGETLKGFLAP